MKTLTFDEMLGISHDSRS